MIKSNGEARQRGWQRDRRSRFRWLQWKRWFAWIWIFLWDIFENPWRYRNVFFYQVVTPVAYKRGQQSYAISGSKNFKGENTQLIRLLSTPQQLLPRSPSWSSNNGEERFERKRGVSLGASLWCSVFLRTDFTWWRIQQGWSLQFVLLADPYCTTLLLLSFTSVYGKRASHHLLAVSS